jgi:hypothetical protein
MPSTYTPINTTTITGSTTSVVNFNSIPSTFTDLVLVINARAATNASASIQFNSDAGTNYGYTVIDAEGTAIQANRQTNTSGIQLISWSIGMGSTTIPSVSTTHINSYNSTAIFKTVITRSAAMNASNTRSVDGFIGTWRNTAAINSITINCNTIAIGSTFSLYGIKAA